MYENLLIWYTCEMTKLLDEALDRLRELPEEMQEAAARSIIRTLEEEPETKALPVHMET